MVIIVEKCCCSTSLERGTSIISILLMLRAAIHLIFASVLLANAGSWIPKEEPGKYDELSRSFVKGIPALLALWILVNITELAANILLRCKPDNTEKYLKYLREWLRVMKWLALLYAILLPALSFTCFHAEFWKAGIAFVVWGLAQWVTNFYCYIVIYSNYKTMI